MRPHEILWIGGGKRLRVLDVRPAQSGSQYAALLTVERADSGQAEREFGLS